MYSPTQEMVGSHQPPAPRCAVAHSNASPIDAATPSSLPPSPVDGTGVTSPGNVVPHGIPSAPLKQSNSLLEPTIVQPFPLPSASPLSLPTPLQDDRFDLSLDFAGSALIPSDVSLPTPPITKAHNLRLPSFDLLGIAAPHPDRVAFTGSAFSPLGAGPLSKPEDPLHALSPPLGRPPQHSGFGRPPISSPEPARAKIDRLVPIVTPPNENEPGTFNWGSFVNVRTAGLGSPPSSEPGVSPNIASTTANATSPLPELEENSLSVASLSDALGMAAWVGQVKDIITSEVPSARFHSVKVLSHALPCPSLTGHLFGQIIATIHERSTTPTAWINVFHAVPGRFTLADLPKSPPSTPGQVVDGDEYFTSKVFDTAVAVPDYQLDAKLLPPSPRPVVPPGSVNISVVERYIPPTNANEFTEMFSAKPGRSLLLDRLIELSSDNGMLLFIYPTQRGARTFMQDYLGPVLDPLLRSITIVHDLSSELGKSLGPMSAVNRMAEYPFLLAALTNFCAQLNRGDSTLHPSGGEKRAKYEVIHSSTETIVLERRAWANDWWIKQEKPRVRDVVTKYFRKARHLPADSSMTPTNLIQEVLDGVATRDFDTPIQPRGIELGVFVVKKSC